jgi:hypothetical protein
VRLNGSVWLVKPTVAVIVKVYVPRGVPPEPDDPDDPPPHESSSANPAIAIIVLIWPSSDWRSLDRPGRRDIGNTSTPIPKIADAHNQDDLGKCAPAVLGAAVLTVAESGDALGLGAAAPMPHGESGTNEQLTAHVNGGPMTVQAGCSGGNKVKAHFSRS